MKAETYDLRTILTLERRFVIPTFQRDYEWTEAGQWSLLFDDLEAVVEHLEDARHVAAVLGEPVTKADGKVAPHFLGAVVLEGIPGPAGSLDRRSVIDGQQRLTTIQLLVRGVLDVLIERGSARVAQVRRLIQNPSDVVADVDERFKVWPRRRDRDVWRVALADSPASATGHLYLEARKYFRERSRVAVGGVDGADRSDLVVDSLLSLFKLVVIDLEENDDAQVIFEVLNGRQTPLSATDLVKNLLFLRAELASEVELESLYDRYWAQLDDPWWKKEIGRGHAARGRRDVLLSSWLTAASRSEVNVGHLYREVRRYLDGADHKIEDILVSLHAAARAFREIFEPPVDVTEAVAAAYRRNERLSVTTALPLLVWLRTLDEEQLTGEEHSRAVTAIDSWVVRRLIVGANTRGYGKKFVDVLAAAQVALETGNKIALAVENALVDAGTENLTWPTDTEVEAAFLTRQFYDNLTQERIRMLLGAIDLQMQHDNVKGEHPAYDYDTLQIEHLLPQKWLTYWPVSGNDEAEKTLRAQRRDLAKNRIGNLTLVSGPLNLPMSNGPWVDKRPALKEYSGLRLNAALLSSEDWDEAAIDQRAKNLATIATRVWPRPTIEANISEVP